MTKIINQDSLANLSGGVDCSTIEGFAFGAMLIGGIIGGSTGGVIGGFFGVLAGNVIGLAALRAAGCAPDQL